MACFSNLAYVAKLASTQAPWPGWLARLGTLPLWQLVAMVATVARSRGCFSWWQLVATRRVVSLMLMYELLFQHVFMYFMGRKAAAI